MYVLKEVKKMINSTNKPFKMTFRNRADKVTLGTIDKLVGLGCSITKKRNNLIVEKQ